MSVPFYETEISLMLQFP